MAVLPPRRGDLVRPFLRARRKDIEAHIARHEVPFADDPSNLDPRFLRSRVRNELMPMLRALSPGIVAHLNGLADDLLAATSADADATGAAYLAPLPRASRVALAALAATRSPMGRVRLPDGPWPRSSPRCEIAPCRSTSCGRVPTFPVSPGHREGRTTAGAEPELILPSFRDLPPIPRVEEPFVRWYAS